MAMNPGKFDTVGKPYGQVSGWPTWARVTVTVAVAIHVVGRLGRGVGVAAVVAARAARWPTSSAGTTSCSTRATRTAITPRAAADAGRHGDDPLSPTAGPEDRPAPRPGDLAAAPLSAELALANRLFGGRRGPPATAASPGRAVGPVVRRGTWADPSRVPVGDTVAPAPPDPRPRPASRAVCDDGAGRSTSTPRSSTRRPNGSESSRATPPDRAVAYLRELGRDRLGAGTASSSPRPTRPRWA